jgi:predicted RNA methylase
MKTILLTNRGEALVDDEDFEFLNQWTWYAKRGKSNKDYAVRCIIQGGKKITVRMHRVIMNCPVGMTVDHHDRNTLNNQKFNLENVTSAENTKRIHYDKV